MEVKGSTGSSVWSPGFTREVTLGMFGRSSALQAEIPETPRVEAVVPEGSPEGLPEG